MASRSALIFGASGQDGAFLSRFLLGKGYTVYGASRDAERASFRNLRMVGAYDDVTRISLSLTDLPNLFSFLQQVRPDEVYNLSGQSSVSLSFDQPVETWQSNTLGNLNLLEVLRTLRLESRVYVAGSSEVFGDTGGTHVNEDHGFAPRSPYGSAKAAAFWTTKNYREAYGLFACTGLMFNHESPLRPANFVTRKIVRGAVDIAGGRASELVLGRLDIRRDWGYAAEYVEAMWLMLQQDEASDTVVATGVTHSLTDFVDQAFKMVDLDWREHVSSNPSLFRPHEIDVNAADPSKAKENLGWEAKTTFAQLVELMVQAEKEERRR